MFQDNNSKRVKHRRLNDDRNNHEVEYILDEEENIYDDVLQEEIAFMKKQYDSVYKK